MSSPQPDPTNPDPESIEQATRALRRIRLANRPDLEMDPAELASRMILIGRIREKLADLPVEVLVALTDAMELIADEPDRYRLEWVDRMPIVVEVDHPDSQAGAGQFSLSCLNKDSRGRVVGGGSSRHGPAGGSPPEIHRDPE